MWRGRRAPGENCYRVRVDRVSDARFERMALLGFLDRDDADGAAVAFETNEMSYLHQHMFWRVSPCAKALRCRRWGRGCGCASLRTRCIW